jgi:uncharacterized protein YndB with AHSA1/START domain
MNAQNYTATFAVDQTPAQVFAAVTNPRAWWSEQIDGPTDQLGAEFRYHYRDVHRAKFKITEFVPGKKVVWHVVENYFDFVEDKTEWTGTDVVFEIGNQGDKTELRFTHVGLIPAYECYNVCTDAWGSYVKGSLRNLIATGTGQPNPIEAVVARAEEMKRLDDEHERRLRKQDYTTSFTVDQSPEEVVAAINNPRGWWSGEIDGRTDKLGAVFTYRFADVHYCRLRIVELVPGQAVVWHVLESDISYTKDRHEWDDTKISFEVSRKGGKTEVRFTHVGLVPQDECYESCSDAWGGLVRGNLRKLIATGKAQPNLFATTA